MKSVHSTADEVLFRVELSVLVPTAFEEFRAARQLAESFGEDAVVVPQGGDWWNELWRMMPEELKLVAALFRLGLRSNGCVRAPFNYRLRYSSTEKRDRAAAAVAACDH